jgi:hypothetical protein
MPARDLGLYRAFKVTRFLIGKLKQFNEIANLRRDVSGNLKVLLNMGKNNKFILLISCLIFLCLTNSCHNQKAHNTTNKVSSFAGSWHLISRIDKTNTGTIINEPTLGSNPISLLMYDHWGNMSVQIMRKDRNGNTTTKSVELSSDNSTAINGYDAYFGTYIIDTLKHQVTHQIKGSINQRDVGKELIRNYSISGDTLLLWFTTTNSSDTVTRMLTWVREKGK